MKTGLLKISTILCLSLLLVIGMVTPSQSEMPFADQLEYVGCVEDNNEAHVNATILRMDSRIYDSVCGDDQFDWYLIPLPGDVMWAGKIECVSDSPGLAVKFYLDTGAGPQLVEEASPALGEWLGGEDYYLGWDILELATSAGVAAGPPGNYYIRVSYYSAYPGEHPYMLDISMRPYAYNPSPYNSTATARTLPPGIALYGHLAPADLSDWYKFNIGTGQLGSGVIFTRTYRKGPVLLAGYGDFEEKRLIKIEPELYEFKVNLRAADNSLIGTAVLTPYMGGFIDLRGTGNLPAGDYYIEATVTGTPPSDLDIYYMVFDHVLAPDSGDWADDLNSKPAEAAAFTEGVPIDDTVYWPRDRADYYSFSVTNYFLGDIIIEPSFDAYSLKVHLEESDGTWQYCMWLPGLGLTCRYDPAPAGNYYFVVEDSGAMVSPFEYSVTYYEHGPPMTIPIGHNTWETAAVLSPTRTPEFRYMGNQDVVIEFQPGVQNVFYATMTVPSDRFLVGYYDIYGSRTNYRVRLGQIGPAGTPVWAPALNPDSKGKLTIDMNYDYLTDAGTYYLKVEMLPSSPGRMRILVDNHTRIAECATDENEAYTDAINLKYFYSGGYYSYEGELCPSLDNADWYYFESGLFDEAKGPCRTWRCAAGPRV